MGKKKILEFEVRAISTGCFRSSVDALSVEEAVHELKKAWGEIGDNYLRHSPAQKNYLCMKDGQIIEQADTDVMSYFVRISGTSDFDDIRLSNKVFNGLEKRGHIWDDGNEGCYMMDETAYFLYRDGTKFHEGDTITISPSKSADSRTAQGDVSKEQLLASSRQHIEDVEKAMNWFARLLKQAGKRHDFTKISGIDTFHENFTKSQHEPDYDFTADAWYQMHVTSERHHIDAHCAEDVNLIDVMERIADIVMAGLGRRGDVYPDNLDPSILEKAYQNTIKLLTSNVFVRNG